MVRYQLSTNVLPHRIDDLNHNVIAAISDFIDPQNVPLLEVIVALPPSGRWDRRSSAIELFCFGRYRSRFAALNALSETLAPYYSELLVFPIVTPVIVPRAELQTVLHSEWFHHVMNTGILSYSRTSR